MSNKIPTADTAVIVDDGSYRWIGDRAQVYAWLRNAEIARGHDSARNLSNAARMSADEYQQLCDHTTCYADTSGSYSVPGHDTHALIDSLIEQGAPTLHIA